MDDKSNFIARMRSFNRYYTKLLGLLDRDILHSGYSLAEVRTLYELDKAEETTANHLIEELGMDPSYMSRILARLEKAGYIKKGVSPEDGRVKTLRLTEEGRRALTELDYRSTEQLGHFIGPLTDEDCRQICEAMDLIQNKFGGYPENRCADISLQSPHHHGKEA